MWPPGYYMLRDRAPFGLTLLYMLYLLKPEIRDYYRHLTYWLLVSVVTITAASLTLYLTDGTLAYLFGITWTYPAPIEWGTYIMAAYTILQRRTVPGFESMYLALVTAFACGWIYEIPRWIQAADYWTILNLNASKVFFIRYQILCIPIAAYVIHHRTQYTPPRHLTAAALLYLAFSIIVATTHIGRISDRILDRSWCWLARVPTQLIMLYTLTGVRGPADE